VPDDLKELVPCSHILCMHPLGAKLCPPPVCNSISSETDIKIVTFAVFMIDIPPRVHVDSSYSWDYQRGIAARGLQGEALAKYLIFEMGSFVSYDVIPPENLRVFCEGDQPSNPLSWRPFQSAKNSYRFAKSP
jgi:hypothetical protein